MRRSLAAVLAGALALAGSTLQAQTTIGSGPAIAAANAAPHGFTSEGQIFRTPTIDNVLQSFTFEMWDVADPTEFLFQVFAWSGSSPTGPALFSARSMGPGGTTVSPVTIATGGLSLDPGGVYAAVMSRSGGDIHWGMWASNDSYGGGSFIRRDAAGIWSTFATHDASFSATFVGAADPTITPEPVSMALLGTGLAGMGALRRRRRKLTEAETD